MELYLMLYIFLQLYSTHCSFTKLAQKSIFFLNYTFQLATAAMIKELQYYKTQVAMLVNDKHILVYINICCWFLVYFNNLHKICSVSMLACKNAGITSTAEVFYFLT